MKLTNVEKKEKNMVELSITVEKEQFEDACQQSYKKNVGKINIQGFRPGKAPRKMIEKMYGPEVFYEDAMDICYGVAYTNAVEQADIDPIAQPSLTDFDVKDGEFSFKAVVAVKPQVEVTNYKGVSAVKNTVSITAKEVNEELSRMQERNARLVAVDRKIKKDDSISLDFEGFVEGKPFDGGKAENFNLKIGSGMFIPGFEDQLIGKAAGTECEVNVTFPEEYQEASLAGKPAVFKCKVLEVKESQKPELDDEFAKDVSEFDTIADLKSDLKKKLTEAATSRADNEYEEALMDKVIEGLEADIPDVMFENQVDRIVDDFGYRLSMQGMDMDAYLKMNQMEPASFRKLFRGQAERQVKIRLALEKIAILEKLDVTDADLDTEFNTLAEQNKLTVERVKELLPADSLKTDLMVQKAADFIKANGKIEAPKAEEKPAAEEKKPAAKKAAAKKTADDTATEKKPAAKKTTKKADKAE